MGSRTNLIIIFTIFGLTDFEQLPWYQGIFSDTWASNSVCDLVYSRIQAKPMDKWYPI